MKNKYIIKLENSLQINNKYKLLKTGNYVKIYSYLNILDKKKINIFTGLIISKRNKGISTSIIVRKNFNNNEGVEKTFFIYSPNIFEIEVIKIYKFKKSKLFCLLYKLNKIVKFI